MAVVAGRRQGQNGMHSVARLSVGDRLAFGVTLADDLLQPAYPAFDLEEDHVAPVLETDIGRLATRAGDRNLHPGHPVWWHARRSR
jgi:hypothetical protein